MMGEWKAKANAEVGSPTSRMPSGILPTSLASCVHSSLLAPFVCLRETKEIQRDPTGANGSQWEPTRSSQSQARSIRTVSASDSIRCRLLDLQSSISRANVSLARLSLPSLGAWRDRKQVARLHLAPRLRLFALASMASNVLSALPLPSVVRSVVCSTQSHKREPSKFTSEY